MKYAHLARQRVAGHERSQEHVRASLIGIIAAITIPLAGAFVLGADSRTVAGTPVVGVLTADDREFIEATDKVITMSSGLEPEWRWVGYPAVPAQLRINTAYGVRDMLDGGALSANDFIVTALGDTREHAGYLAAWFQQIAIVHYCPRHSDKIGTI